MDEPITKADLRQMHLLLINEIREMINSRETKGNIAAPEWMRSREIRKILNISAGTLQNLRIQGKIRHKKVMGSYYYKRSDLDMLFKEEEL